MNTPFVPTDQVVTNLDNLIGLINISLREKSETLRHHLPVVVSIPSRYTEDLIKRAIQEFENVGWVVTNKNTLNVLTFQFGTSVGKENVSTIQT